jgi:NAD(P)-dependent dehydrogenase (short-subunit alcohol dehydrogenase family)
MADHSSRIAVVAGAGSGAAVALALAGDGWVVVLAGRRPEALASVAARGAELAGVLDPAPTDVTDEASVRALFDRTVDRHGRVDLLFNNAGGWAPARELDTVPLAEWNAVVAVNLHILVTIRCDLRFEAGGLGRARRSARRTSPWSTASTPSTSAMDFTSASVGPRN